MISFPLNIKRASAALHTPAAWFIPGDDPQTWLAEIARWGIGMEALQLFVVAQPTRGREPREDGESGPPALSPPPVLRGRVREGVRAGDDPSTQPPPQPSPGVPGEGEKMSPITQITCDARQQ